MTVGPLSKSFVGCRCADDCIELYAPMSERLLFLCEQKKEFFNNFLQFRLTQINDFRQKLENNDYAARLQGCKVYSVINRILGCCPYVRDSGCDMLCN